MSLFRKPKKIQRRVFSSALDDDDDNDSRDMDNSNGGGGGGCNERKKNPSEDMELGEELVAPPPPQISAKKKTKDGKSKSSGKSSGSGDSGKPKALLSFADEGNLKCIACIKIVYRYLGRQSNESFLLSRKVTVICEENRTWCIHEQT